MVPAKIKFRGFEAERWQEIGICDLKNYKKTPSKRLGVFLFTLKNRLSLALS